MPSQTPARVPSALDALANQYVEDLTAKDPFLATSLGIPGHDAEVTDHSPAAQAERTGLARELLAAISEVPDEDEVDAVTRAALQERLGLELERDAQHLDIAAVNNLASVLQSRDVLDQMPTYTAQDWELLAERMAAFPLALGTWAESLREARRPAPSPRAASSSSAPPRPAPTRPTAASSTPSRARPSATPRSSGGCARAPRRRAAPIARSPRCSSP